MSNVVRLPRAPVAAAAPRRRDIPRPAGAAFTGEGEARLAEVCQALDTNEEVVLSGVAGSGKTTIVKWLAQTYLTAPTAKAARRLAEACSFQDEKPREAHTVHSTIHGQPEELWYPPDSLEPCSTAKTTGQSCVGCSCRLGLVWPSKEISLKPGAVLVVDESSMLDADMVHKIRHRVAELSRKVPDLRILWVGDPAQLPPVNGQPGIDLQHPDVMLTEVHRTKRPGILNLSTEIRHCQNMNELGSILDRIGRGEFPAVTIAEGSWPEAATWRRQSADGRMLITWANFNRVKLNRLVRKALGRESLIQKGDRIIIRTSNHMTGVLNGEVVTVAAATIHEASNTARVGIQHDGKIKNIVVMLDLLEAADRDAFFRQRGRCSAPWSDPIVNVQYGYSLTCHSAQGSQADHVGVVWTGSDMRKDFASAKSWLYTAITRAQESLTIWLVRS